MNIVAHVFHDYNLAFSNPSGKSIGSAVSAQLTAESLYTLGLQWATHFLKLPFLLGELDLHLIHDSLGQCVPTVQTASRSVRLFSHR